MKSKKGSRTKMAITLDTALYDELQALYQKGYSISHILDSAVWLYLGKPPLSFEKEDK